MPPKAGPRSDWIVTPTQNKVSRRSLLHGTPNIIIGGKCVINPDVLIRGDLVRPPTTTTTAPSNSTTDQPKPPQQTPSVSLGRYVYISPSCILRPPSRLTTTTNPDPNLPSSTVLTHYPLRMESQITVGPSTIISAASIGSHVEIGANCVIGNMVIIKDYVKVLDGTVLAANSVWPSFSVVAGRPGRVVGEVGEGWGVLEGGPGGESRERWRDVKVGPGGR